VLIQVFKMQAHHKHTNTIDLMASTFTGWMHFLMYSQRTGSNSHYYCKYDS